MDDGSMRKSKFAEEQNAMAVRHGQGGTPEAEICRKLGARKATRLRWRKRNGELAISELREVRQMREENRKLKGTVADLTLDRTILLENLREDARAHATPRPGGVGRVRVSDIAAAVLQGHRGNAVAGWRQESMSDSGRLAAGRDLADLEGG